MIPDRWYAVLESKEVPRRGMVGVRRFGEQWVVWRDAAGAVAAVQDRCPHRGAALSGGRVVDGHVECPFHGFRYDASGRATLIPALGRSTQPPAHVRGVALPLHEVDGFVWAWWGEGEPTEPPTCFFEELGDRLMWSSFRDPWPVHYTRSIENQLDVVHLPFVHRTTIGRSIGVVVDGPHVELDGDDLLVWIHNRPDDGTPPAADLDSDGKALLKFRFPNTWLNDISPTVKVAAAFVPVDEGSSVVYVRYYQGMLTLPVLGRLFTWLGKVFSIVILRQDKRVVVTQDPPRSWLKMGEKLIRGDQPIVAYRQHRRTLMGGDDAP